MVLPQNPICQLQFPFPLLSFPFFLSMGFLILHIHANIPAAPNFLQILIIVLYTISNLAITSLFPVRTQALAGGVFNTIAQIGNSVGLAITSIVAASVTAAKTAQGGDTP